MSSLFGVKARSLVAAGGLVAVALVIVMSVAIRRDAPVAPQAIPAAIPASAAAISTVGDTDLATERPTPSPQSGPAKPAVRPAARDALSPRDRAQIEGLLAEAVYAPTPVTDGPDAGATALRAANPRQEYVAHFDDRGFALAGGKDQDWRLPVRLAAYGAPEDLKPLAAASPVQSGERVEFRRGNVTEWYVNRPGGVEQGFDVAEAPEGAGESLRFEMEVGGGFTAEQDGDDIRLNNAEKNARLRYAGLIVKDATGRKLHASMRGQGDKITVDVDARDAVYPIVVDPTFTQVARLNASDATAIDQFGYSIDVSGSTVVVGANTKDSGAATGAGAAYVFVRSGGVWSQQARLTPTDPAASNDNLGQSIAISGDTAVVGAPGKVNGAFNSGAVYVFTRSGATWTQQARLVSPDAVGTDRFGNSVDIDGDTVVVGAHQADDGGVNNSGSVYVFTRSAGVWSQQAELTASDRLASDNLGYSVALSGDTVISGAYSEDSLGSLSGAAYVFTRSGTTWSQQAKLKASDASADDRFGYFVAASGDTVIVGAPFAEAGGTSRGSAYVFTRSGTTWTQQTRLQPSSAADNAVFGYAVAVQGDTAAIAAQSNPAGGISRGAVFVYTRTASVWTQQQMLIASDQLDRDRLGSSVSIDGVSIATGATGRDDAGNSSGAAYVFSDTSLTTTQAVASRTVSVGAAITPFTPVTASGGLGVLSYAISPGLPAGLSFSTTTGQITGTPTSASATTTYTVTVTDQTTPTAQTSSKTFSLTVDPPAAPPLNTTQAVASRTATVGSAITAFTPVTASGGAGLLSYAISPGLPAGLSFNTANGQITGTPTAASATTTYTVTVTDQAAPVAQTSFKTFSLTVNPALDTVQAVASRILTQGVAATAFTPVTASGGTGTLSYAVSPGLPAGLAFNTANGQITGAPTATSAATTYTVTVTDQTTPTAQTSSKTFSLTVDAALTTTQAVPSATATVGSSITPFIPVTGSGGTGTLSYAVSPGLPAGLSFNTANGQITGTPAAPAAAATFTVTVTDQTTPTAQTSSKTFSLTVNGALDAVQAVASRILTQGVAATAFTPVTASGGTGALSYAVSPGLPAGLSFNTANGQITGTPTATSAATTYTVTVTDQTTPTAQTSSRTFSLTVDAALGTIQAVASTTLTVGSAATPFTPVTAAGGTGTVTYAVSPGLPAGLSFNTANGQITGTPSAASGATTYTVTATDQTTPTAQTSSKTFSVTVNGALDTVQAVASRILTQGVAATAFTPVTASGGTGALSYAVSPGLPAGLAFNTANGQITGAPTTTSAAATFTVTVTDQTTPLPQTSSRTFSLTVDAALGTTQAVASTVLTVGSAATPFTPVTAAGGTGTVTYAVSPGLPAGLSFNTANGQITGTPSAASGATTYTVTATDQTTPTAQTSSKTFSLTVDAALGTTQAVASTTLTVGSAATPFTPVTASGGTGVLSYAVSPGLPAGLSFNTTNGQITGTPTAAAGLALFAVTVTDQTTPVPQTSSRTFSLTVNGALDTAQAVASRILTQSVAATAFTPVTASGGTGTLSYAVSPGLPAGLSFNTTNGQITGTPTATAAAATFTVTVTDQTMPTAQTSSKTFSLTVDAALTTAQAVPNTTLTAGSAITPFIPVTASGGTGVLSYAVSPGLPAGLSFNTTNGQITGTPTAAAGLALFTVTITDQTTPTAQTSSRTFSLSINAQLAAATVVPSRSLVEGAAATPFTPVTASGGTGVVVYAVSPGLPAGLSFNTTNGQITGTPTATAVTTTFTVTATDQTTPTAQTASATFELTVDPALSASTAVAATNLTRGQAATPFIPVTGAGGVGLRSFSVSPGLPAGLSYTPATGQVTGTPTAASPLTLYTVTVTDQATPVPAMTSATFSLAVLLPVPVLPTTTIPDASASTVYSATINPATGGTAPFTYAVTAGALPPGILLSSDGTLSGIPASPGVYAFTITVTDSEGQSASQSFTMTIGAPPPPAPIPTLSEWAMMMLGLLLAGVAGIRLNRRRMA